MGNTKWFGLGSLVLSSMGYLIFFLGMQIFAALKGGPSTLSNIYTGWLVLSPLFLVPSLIIPLLVRIGAMPIIGHFKHD